MKIGRKPSKGQRRNVFKLLTRNRKRTTSAAKHGEKLNKETQNTHMDTRPKHSNDSIRKSKKRHIKTGKTPDWKSLMKTR